MLCSDDPAQPITHEPSLMSYHSRASSRRLFLQGPTQHTRSDCRSIGLLRQVDSALIARRLGAKLPPGIGLGSDAGGDPNPLPQSPTPTQSRGDADQGHGTGHRSGWWSAHNPVDGVIGGVGITGDSWQQRPAVIEPRGGETQLGEADRSEGHCEINRVSGGVSRCNTKKSAVTDLRD